MAKGFPHRHLLDIERLSKDDIETILDRAADYAEFNRKRGAIEPLLHGKTVASLFFEPSTRTSASFEIAAKRLGADVVDTVPENSSTQKGETVLDTALNLDAMGIDALVIRHSDSGVPHFIAPQMKASVINAGDGANEHPTQALLDALVMQRRKPLKDITVAICGDIAHSRVARSNVHLLNKLGAEVRLIAPPFFMPKGLGNLSAEVHEDIETGLKDVDVVMMLRIQHERMETGELPLSLKDYHRRYGLDHVKLKVAKKDVIIMHPGPINRDVEITSTLADDPQYSVVLEQTAAGVAVRMAVLDLLLN